MNIKTANRLCELRKKHNLSQEELASMLGVSRQAVSKLERSESSPDTDNLIELAKIYNITLDELLNGDEAIDLINENKDANAQSMDNNENNGNGIYIEDDEDSVQITKNGIFLKDKNSNESININHNGIIHDDTFKKTFKAKFEPVKDGITGGYTILATATYITLGIMLKDNVGWKYFWFLFLLIPVIPSIFDIFYKRKITAFCYPVAVTAAYCGFGMYYHIWHPLWLIFLTIPVFYIIFEPIDKIISKNDTNFEE